MQTGEMLLEKLTPLWIFMGKTLFTSFQCENFAKEICKLVMSA